MSRQIKTMSYPSRSDNFLFPDDAFSVAATRSACTSLKAVAESFGDRSISNSPVDGI
jgi:hypothetical protein